MPILETTLFRQEGFEGKLVYDQRSYSSKIGTNSEHLFTGTQDYVEFGRFLVQTSFNEWRLPQAGDTDFQGISLAVDYYEKIQLADRSYVHATRKGCPLSILKRGAIYVVAEDDIAAGSPLFVRVVENAVPGAHEALGRVRSDADGGNAVAVDATRVKLVGAAVAGELAVVHAEFLF